MSYEADLGRRVERMERVIEALIDILYELETESEGGLLTRKHAAKIEAARKGRDD